MIRKPSEKDTKRLQELFHIMGKRYLERTQAAKEEPQPIYDEAFFRVYLEERPYVDRLVCFRRKSTPHTDNTQSPGNLALTPFSKWEVEFTEIEALVNQSGGVFLRCQEGMVPAQVHTQGTFHSLQPTETKELFEIKGLKSADLENALENPQGNVWLEMPQTWPLGVISKAL
jgi:hypothetical protein